MKIYCQSYQPSHHEYYFENPRVIPPFNILLSIGLPFVHGLIISHTRIVIVSPDQFELLKHAVKGSNEIYRLHLYENSENQVAQLRTALLSNARELLGGIEKNIKWQASLRTVFAQATNPNIVTKPPMFFLTEPVSSTSGDPLELQLKVALRRLMHQVDGYEKNGSGWVLDHFVTIDVHILKYNPLRAGAHIPLSKNIRGKASILNIKNMDNDWYVYSLLVSHLIITRVNETCFQAIFL